MAAGHPWVRNEQKAKSVKLGITWQTKTKPLFECSDCPTSFRGKYYFFFYIPHRQHAHASTRLATSRTKSPKGKRG